MTIAAPGGSKGKNSPGSLSNETSEGPPANLPTDKVGNKRVKIVRYREKTKEEKPGDRVVSAVNKDARRGAKSAKKFFLGPKSEINLTGKSHLVLNAKAIAGNEPDGEHIFEMVDEVKEVHGIEPPKIIGDGKYGGMDTRTEGIKRVNHIPIFKGHLKKRKLFIDGLISGVSPLLVCVFVVNNISTSI